MVIYVVLYTLFSVSGFQILEYQLVCKPGDYAKTLKQSPWSNQNGLLLGKTKVTVLSSHMFHFSYLPDTMAYGFLWKLVQWS